MASTRKAPVDEAGLTVLSNRNQCFYNWSIPDLKYDQGKLFTSVGLVFSCDSLSFWDLFPSIPAKL